MTGVTASTSVVKTVKQEVVGKRILCRLMVLFECGNVREGLEVAAIVRDKQNGKRNRKNCAMNALLFLLYMPMYPFDVVE